MVECVCKIILLFYFMRLLKVSPKGQITIPQDVRKNFIHNQLLFEVNGKVITLRSITIEAAHDELADFSGLSAKAFDFWSDEKDDVYSQFYNKKK